MSDDVEDKEDRRRRLREEMLRLIDDVRAREYDRDLFRNGELIAAATIKHLDALLADETWTLLVPVAGPTWRGAFSGEGAPPFPRGVRLRGRWMRDEDPGPGADPIIRLAIGGRPFVFDDEGKAVLWTTSRPPPNVREDIALYLRGTGKTWIGDRGPSLEAQMDEVAAELAALDAEAPRS